MGGIVHGADWSNILKEKMKKRIEEQITEDEVKKKIDQVCKDVVMNLNIIETPELTLSDIQSVLHVIVKEISVELAKDHMS